MNTGLDDSAASGSLPGVVSNYLAASDRDDIDAIVACFTEGRRRARRRPALAWGGRRFGSGAKVATAFEYTVAIIGSEALGEVDGGQRLEVYTHLEGNFPGGQVDLTNRFSLRGDLIVGLEIVPTAVTP